MNMASTSSQSTWRVNASDVASELVHNVKVTWIVSKQFTSIFGNSDAIADCHPEVFAEHGWNNVKGHVGLY
jgi:hypothetical protein